MIDLSHAVENDQLYALDFLRRDIHNVHLFFRKQRVLVFPVQEVFRFITDPSVDPE